MTKESNPKKYLSTPLKIIIVLLTISIVLLTTYAVSANLTKNSVIDNLKPIISELSAIPGAKNVEVKVCAEPNTYSMPWDLEFHAFLTVKLSHLGQLGEEKALEILNNGVELGKTEYSYDWYDLDYAIYTRSVNDSVFGNTHPVFVTLTDGDKSYTIKKDNLFDENALYMGDTYSILRPSSSHQIISIFTLTTIVFLGVLVFIVCKKVEKKREIDKAQREEIEAAKKNETTIGFNHILGEIDREITHDEAIRRKAKKKKILLVASAAVVVVALVVLSVINLVVIPTNQYNQAVALRAAGNDAEAYAIFNSLGDFKDAKDICNAYDYIDALAYLDEGHPETAFYILKNMSGYPEAETKATELLKEYPYFSILCAVPGDEVILGTYEQDNNISNGPEGIEWIVLKNENGVVYAVSKYILDAQVYNTHNGDGSTLKGWLKDDFYNVAFFEVQKGFVSKVGLLSRDDLDMYQIANTKPEWTAYAKAQGPENHYYAGYSWWLDGEYFHGFATVEVEMSVVIESGSYSNNISDITSVNGVRPTIIIDCISNDIDYYAEDYKDIENAGVTTRTQSQVDAEVDSILGSDQNTNSGTKRTVCSWCGGDGKTHDWGTEMHGSGHTCTKCGGDGWLEYEG